MGKSYQSVDVSEITQKKEGDVIYIKSIDRLGRNYEEILEQWRILTKKRRIL